MNAQDALKKLKEGNERFARGKAIHPHCDKTRLAEVLDEQSPYAIVVSCSDSRVPVEIIFDAGIGDIFTIRTAGHVLSKEVMGSIEYAVEHLGVELIVILGHETCGAVTSALKAYKERTYKHLSDNLKALLFHIHDLFDTKYSQETVPDVQEATIALVRHLIDEFEHKSQFLKKKIKKKELTLYAADYSLKTGLVNFH